MDNQENDKIQYARQLLVDDFQQAFYMLRHYDEVNWSLTKFSFGQSLVSLGACWTVSFEANKPTANLLLQTYYPIGIFILLFLSAAFTLISILGICKNRTYFVKVSRYINEHRQYALNNCMTGFANVSKMWDNPNFPSNLDKGSTQMICLYLLGCCYIVEIVLAAVILNYMDLEISKILVSIIFFVIAVLIFVVSIMKILKD